MNAPVLIDPILIAPALVTTMNPTVAPIAAPITAPTVAPRFAPTPHTTLQRHPERGSHDRATVHAILDSHWLCHIAFNDAHGPHVLPTIYWRENDRIYIHGALQSRMLLALAEGAPACVNVTLIDGLVFAKRAFNHSANYRSVNLYGRFTRIDDDDYKQHAFRHFFDTVLPDRWPQVVPVDDKERNATLLLALPIENAVAKIRSGPPGREKGSDDEAGYTPWTGVLPLQMQALTPEPAGADLSAQLLKRACLQAL